MLIRYSAVLPLVCLTALLSMAAVPLQAQDTTVVPPPPVTNTVYKSVDSKGQVTFTDTAPVGRPSEEIKVQTANTMPASSSSSPVVSEAAGGNESERVKYTQLVITSPANDELLGQDIETVTLTVQLEPSLQKGHTFQLYYDGKPVGDGSTSYTVTGLERGTHTVEAKVFDNKKKLVKAADPVQFTVRRISALNKLTAAQLSAAGGTKPVKPVPPPPGGFGAPKGASSTGDSNSAGDTRSPSGAGSIDGANGAQGAGPRVRTK